MTSKFPGACVLKPLQTVDVWGPRSRYSLQVVLMERNLEVSGP